MSSIEFPSSPSNGQNFVASNGVIYIFPDGGWYANTEEALTANYVNVSGDTMTGNLAVTSINSITYLTAAEAALAADGDAVVYDAAADALKLKDLGSLSEITSGGGAASDADTGGTGPGKIIGETPTVTGYTQIQFFAHGVFAPGQQGTNFQAGCYVRKNVQSTDSCTGEFVRWSGNDSAGQQCWSVQGVRNIEITDTTSIFIGWKKDGATGSATPMNNSSCRAFYTK